MTFVTAAVAAVLVVLPLVLVILRSVHYYFVAAELAPARRRWPWRGVEMTRGYSFLRRGILISVCYVDDVDERLIL